MSSKGLIEYEQKRLPSYTGRTHDNRAQVLNNWLTFIEEKDLDPDEVSKDDVAVWLRWLRDERGHAHSTIAQNLMELKSVYNWIVAEGLGESACEGIQKKLDYPWLNSAPEKVKNSAEGVTYVDKEDYQLLLNECESMRERVVIQSLAELGIRRSELSSLKIDSFDFDNNSVIIKTAKRYDEDGNKLLLPGFYSTTYGLKVKKWIAGEREGWVAGINSGSEYLVTGHKIPAIREGEVTEIVRDVADRAGIQAYHDDAMGRDWATVTPHALRHSYGVWRAKEGMPLSQLSRLMRHADIQTTYDYYLRFANEDLKDAYDEHYPF
ncbi:site-specific integrase [Halosimplex litoreum]|uniref:Site-specific integrase n=1 Tax=Halosimplex litoreum TaxID=1198301 RepID=A0A7T3G1D4_9EURY|nr:site-specific integrase [Halosimplex litoreum]QPV64517.1 site-specific integrase [Halosimplex litoreum]